MSRIGKLPITIPTDVKIIYTESEITVTGKFGKLHMSLPDTISIEKNENRLRINLKKSTKTASSLQGLYRTLINNMIIGVSKQFTLTLILKGVGYRAVVQDKEIILSLGYSHPIKIEIPKTISVEVVQNTTINLKAADKELLGLFAANIRTWRRPEPYKGKGILYQGEQIIRKSGKSGK